MILCDTLSGFSVTVSVYCDGDTIIAVYGNASGEAVDRSFNPTPERINRRPAEPGVVPAGTEVVTHATAERVRGRHVFGVLPPHLAAEARRVTEVPLHVPAEPARCRADAGAGSAVRRAADLLCGLSFPGRPRVTFTPARRRAGLLEKAL